MNKRTKRYYGEEAQRITWKEEQAANMTIAKLRAGQIDFSDVMVETPKAGEITAYVIA